MLCNQPFDPNDPNTGGSTHWWLTWPDHRTPDPNHAATQVIYSASVLDGLEAPPFLTYSNHLYFDGVIDAEGTQVGFDPTKVVKIEFFGTNWDGLGYDFLDLKDLSITAAGPAIRRGDMNCDGVVDFKDINPFVAILCGGTPCNAANADCNYDSVIDFKDINPFVALLSSGGTCP